MDDKKIIKKQKITIIVLSILTVIYFAACLGGFIYQKIDSEKIEMKFVNSYSQQNSLYYYCELDVLCKQDKMFKVNDFSFKRNNDNICVSKIEMGNSIYNSGENFAISQYERTKIKLYVTLIDESQLTTIYYNFQPINRGETRII